MGLAPPPPPPPVVGVVPPPAVSPPPLVGALAPPPVEPADAPEPFGVTATTSLPLRGASCSIGLNGSLAVNWSSLEMATRGLASNALTTDCLASGLPGLDAGVGVAAWVGVSSAGFTSTTGTATSASSSSAATGQSR